MAEPKEWEKSVWRQQYFCDYEDFITEVLCLKEHLETGGGMNPYKSEWWDTLQRIVGLLSHHHSVLEITRRKYVESNPEEKSIPFGHVPVVK